MAKMFMDKNGAIIVKHTKAEKEAREARLKQQKELEEIEKLKKELEDKLALLDEILSQNKKEEDNDE